MADRGGFAALDSCVHCGFCLPACPTYLATGDENDSPRGRILLMRAFERGEIAADDPALIEHLDACLGCRGCEPVCPSGVGYGAGLETARTRIAARVGIPAPARFTLGIFARRWAWQAATAAARWFRALGLARRFRGDGRLGFLIGMVDATDPAPFGRNGAGGAPAVTLSPQDDRSTGPGAAAAFAASRPAPGERGTVALFRGCVMEGLFGHVHDATRRTLEVNGYRVIEVTGQVCCGALHDHAGDRAGAMALARENLRAFAGKADHLVVDSAGCGAFLKSAGELLGGADAHALAASVRDVTELLAAAGPRPGGAMAGQVCYDPPCHLQHAQRVHQEPLAVLAAIPGLTVRVLPGAERCCGAAGIYGALHPGMSRAVLDAKLETIRAAEPMPALVATGNPGCQMQIGAGLSAAGLPVRTVHPVELLDASYRAAGWYD